jgi:tRNA A-37 threonylcarbamoyl transferase component Bud32
MPFWVQLVAVIAVVKNGAGLALALAPDRFALPARQLLYSLSQYGVLIVAFTATGLVLILARTKDVRAVWLGSLLLVTASPFADTLFGCYVDATEPPVSRLLRHVQVVALQPLFFWLFLARFPHADTDSRSYRWRPAVRELTSVSVVVAIALIASNLSELWLPLGTWPVDPRSLVSRERSGSLFWPVVIGTAAPGLVALARKARAAAAADRRRIGLFAIGLVLGFAPICIEVLLEAMSPSYARVMTQPPAQTVVAAVIFLTLAAVPVVTAYSVMVDRVLEIRVFMRSALQYALAKHTLLLITTIPLVLLGRYVYVHRDQTVARLLTGSGPLALLTAAVAAAVAFAVRRRAMTALDRHFFREQYDARQILIGLAERCAGAPTVDALLALVGGEIDRALHADSVTVLVATPDGAVLRSPDGSIRPLSLKSNFASLVRGDTSPLLVDLERADSALRRLPEEERNWLADAGFALVVPLKSTDGALAGLIGLGAKRSQMPFSREDRLLLEAIASSAALNIENRRLRDTASGREPTPVMAPARVGDDWRPAAECPLCGRVYPPDTRGCDCGGELAESLVPYVLAGKFQFDLRLGSGGMGVVYRALDLDLGRQVAVKTLPRTLPEDAVRLRREAKAMASVQHENLAVIFGAETWRGTPMLVVELLTGGTLAQKLRGGPLPWSQALDVCLALARGIEHLHEAGLLHGDVKPSNIGFGRNGTPKLLDFGVARMLRERLVAGDATTRTAESRRAIASAHQGTNSYVAGGTSLYMSPEALDDEPARPAYDVWSLTVVLFEMLAGVPPFRASSVAGIREEMRREEARNVRAFCSSCPDSVVSFLHLSLSVRPADRPRTAAELQAALSRLRRDLHPG